ncbi:MAG TPA: gliding motility-associated C-terminal domain-containing protein, partial [Saprospiraceae bacterium]|nr:gliding motility-associated C-terminal domain-containing protein [Saprospiraceae bacterium]
SYTLLVTDFKGCTGTASYTVREPSPIMATLTAVDTPKCAEDEILFSVLQATGGAGPVYKFTVNNGAPQDLADMVPLGPGQYSIRIYDKNNCFLDTFIQVRAPNSFLSLDFGISIDTVRLGDSIFLDGKLPPGTVIDTVLWNPSATVRDLFSPSSFVSPNRNTTYTLTVIDENGCVATDQITIIVRNIREFYAPNVFSPNGDGINDFLTFHAGKGVRAIRTVQVFDRWGNKVYQVDQPSLSSESVDTWNGRPGNNGDLMNPGVFVYYAEVEFQDGNVIQYRGDLTLLR